MNNIFWGFFLLIGTQVFSVFSSENKTFATVTTKYIYEYWNETPLNTEVLISSQQLNLLDEKLCASEEIYFKSCFYALSAVLEIYNIKNSLLQNQIIPNKKFFLIPNSLINEQFWKSAKVERKLDIFSVVSIEHNISQFKDDQSKEALVQSELLPIKQVAAIETALNKLFYENKEKLFFLKVSFQKLFFKLHEQFVPEQKYNSWLAGHVYSTYYRHFRKDPYTKILPSQLLVDLENNASVNVSSNLYQENKFGDGNNNLAPQSNLTLTPLSWKSFHWAYLQVHTFLDSGMCGKLNHIFDQIQAHQNYQGIILDLRNNSGGSLISVWCLGSKLLGEQVLFQISPLNGKEKAIYFGDKKDNVVSLPLVVLINSASASGAELLAGSLQDHKRAWIIGERSFGKGTAWTFTPIQQKFQSKLALVSTTETYFLPSGRSIQKSGVQPDFEIPQTGRYEGVSKIFLREEDLYLDGLPRTGSTWIQPRTFEVSQIDQCAASFDINQRKFQITPESQRTNDYNLFTAQEILECMQPTSATL